MDGTKVPLDGPKALPPKSARSHRPLDPLSDAAAVARSPCVRLLGKLAVFEASFGPLGKSGA